jgi:two-component system sensor histidine kinase UhpB
MPNRVLPSPFQVAETTLGTKWHEHWQQFSLFSSSHVVPSLLVALAYYLGTRIGFMLNVPGEPIAAFWPPNAILLASLLLAPRRAWGMFLLAVLPVHLLVQLRLGVPLATSVGWFLGNISEALLGAFCVTYFRKTKSLFDSVQGVIIFLIFGVLLAPLVTSFLDAGVVVMTQWGRHYWILWVDRLFSNMLAELTLVPLIVVLAHSGLSALKTVPAKYFEAFLLAAGIASVSFIVFGGQTPLHRDTPSLIYAPLPLLLWASVRFGLGGLSASLLAVVLISIWQVIHGRGPFTSASMDVNILSLQTMLCMITLPMMLLAAMLKERSAIEEWLRDGKTKLLEAQEQERRRIARELHDDVGQQLALVEMEVTQLHNEAEPPNKPVLEQLRDQVYEISRVTREISHGLHPFILEHLGLGPSLTKLCRDIGQEKSVQINLSIHDLPRSLPCDVSLCIYRVAQEALHNVAKHSHANTATVELEVENFMLMLRIADDGVGFAVPDDSAPGLGLRGMEERLFSVGGTFKIHSLPKEGTRIEAKIPLKQESLPTAASFC